MCVVAAHGLAAVVSRVEETSSAPSVASLLAYERVVEAIHARQAVIPLRYGCLMESESASRPPVGGPPPGVRSALRPA